MATTYLLFLFASVAQLNPSSPTVADDGQVAAPPIFEKTVLPILQSKCISCHSDKVQKSELNLSSKAGVTRGSSSGPVVIAGKASESALIEVLQQGLMPPPNEGVPLTPAEIQVVHKWIESGAHFANAQAVDELTVTEREISQIMLLRCTVCHNGRVKEGGLDLRSRDSMLKGGTSGPAINLENPAESLILKKIRAGEMPPLRKLASASIKVIEKGEVDTLAMWIERGAPPRSDADSINVPSEVTAEDRQFWAFQPPRSPKVPNVSDSSSPRNPIDSFILDKLQPAGLGFSPEGDRGTLVRRAYFDLIGIPPTPEQVKAFVSDDRPNAYEALIDQLLASRQYGERWGRYWLDLAGYSDSDGVNAEDPIRPFAYRYRDYVIQSFNRDKPYDRFLLEQIAGDELADYEQADQFSEEVQENLVATGFLRMAPDGTYNSLTNFVPDRLEVISSEIGVLTSSVMGLTVKCARCHSHKFDPIPHRDYYRLAAIFKGAYDENDWLRPSKAGDGFPLRGLKYVSAHEKESWKVEQKRLEDEIQNHKRRLQTRQQELISVQLEKHLPQLPAVLQDDVKAAALASPEERNEIQKYLISKFEKSLHIGIEELKELDSSFAALAESTRMKIKSLKNQQFPEPFIQALWDRGEPTPTYILRRGYYLTPGKEVEPGVPSVLAEETVPFVVEPPWPGARTTGRRLAFARWLIQPENPLTSRVMVNRIWKHHFAHGIVKSLDNFGKVGQPPSHPELLDWLAIEFVRKGWSVKSLHRLIMTSQTYRQSSSVTADHERYDLDNQLLSRFPLRRLDAEVLRDALLFVAGKLDETSFGPAEAVETRADGLVSSVGTERGWRRSIYLLQRRSQTSTILEDFDLPQMAPNCVERTVATVAPQALHLMNNKTIHDWAGAMADRIISDVGTDRNTCIVRAYEIALGRTPEAAEFEVIAASFEQFKSNWKAQSHPLVLEPSTSAAGSGSEESAAATDFAADRKSLANLCHALMNSAEFIYVD